MVKKELTLNLLQLTHHQLASQIIDLAKRDNTGVGLLFILTVHSGSQDCKTFWKPFQFSPNLSERISST